MSHLIQPPPEISRKILKAITGALQEEKKPRAIRVAKVFVAATLCTAILLTPLFLLFREELSFAWKLAAFAWWVCLVGGFYLYYYPQPRLTVPGYFSPWVFSKILISMTMLTVIQTLICPSFVFLESPLPWSPFTGLTHLFMEWGGMKACMFFCGFLMSFGGGAITFLFVSKTLKRSSLRDVLKVISIAYLSQIPLLIIQLWDDSLREFVSFWITGGLLGLGLACLGIRAMRMKKEAIHGAS